MPIINVPTMIKRAGGKKRSAGMANGIQINNCLKMNSLEYSLFHRLDNTYFEKSQKIEKCVAGR